MKRFAVLAIILGLTLFSLLVAWSGLDDVLDAVAKAGWATAIVIAARAAAIVAEGVAWQLLFPPGQGPGAAICVLLRFIREAVNQLLPVGQVGGDVVGARLATFWRVDGTLAGAATVADVAVQAAGQLVFALSGLAILFALKGDGELVRFAGFGLLFATVGIGLFLLLLRREGFGVIDAAFEQLGVAKEWRGRALIDRFYGQLGIVAARPARIASSGLIHLVVFVFGSVEVYAALHFMGFPITVAEAIVIESLGQAVRGAAFAIPGGLGVQEGGFVALCALFAVPAGPAIALSLVKRVADLALGLPFLLAWQWLEGRRALGAADAERGP